MHRFFLPDLQHLVLSSAEAHHAIHVLRLKPSDTINVFDGRGHQAQCAVGEIKADSVSLNLLSKASASPLPCRMTLAQAVPKKQMDLILQKATELGVSEILPLVSERTIVQLEEEDSRKLDRWRAICLEACKQCGNDWLPSLHPPQKARVFLDELGSRQREFDLKLIASLQPDSRPLKTILADGAALPACPSVLVLIGPEGDFTPAEISLAKSSGCLPLSLGPLVLRAETAALYALSILRHELTKP
jgi:16S rRNA (uracil1498-N3)-methyltransferase